MVRHGVVCWKMNDKQTAKLKSGSIKFKQLSLPFKIYGDFESVLKGARGSDNKNNSSYTEKYQKHIPCRFAYKVVCVDDKFSKPVVLYKGKNIVYRFTEAILQEYDYCKKVIKKHFSKNLVMSAEDEERFQ